MRITGARRVMSTDRETPFPMGLIELQRRTITADDVGSLLGVTRTRVTTQVVDGVFTYCLVDGKQMHVHAELSGRGRGGKLLFDQAEFEALKAALADQEKKYVTRTQIPDELARCGIEMPIEAVICFFEARSGCVSAGSRAFTLGDVTRTLTLHKSTTSRGVSVRYFTREDFDFLLSWLKANYSFRPRGKRQRQPAPEGFCWVDDAAREIGMSESGLRNRVADGTCASRKLDGSEIYVIPKGEVERLKTEKENRIPAGCIKLNDSIAALLPKEPYAYSRSVVFHEGTPNLQVFDETNQPILLRLYQRDDRTYWISKPDFERIESIERGCMFFDELAAELGNARTTLEHSIADRMLSLVLPDGTTFSVPVVLRRGANSVRRTDIESYKTQCDKAQKACVYRTDILSRLGTSEDFLRQLFVDGRFSFTLNGTAHTLEWKNSGRAAGGKYLTVEEWRLLKKYYAISQPHCRKYGRLSNLLVHRGNPAVPIDDGKIVLSQKHGATLPLEEINGVIYVNVALKRLLIFYLDISSRSASSTRRRLEAITWLSDNIERPLPHKREMLAIVSDRLEGEANEPVRAALEAVLKKSGFIDGIDVALACKGLGLPAHAYPVEGERAQLAYTEIDGTHVCIDLTQGLDGIMRVPMDIFAARKAEYERFFGKEGQYVELASAATRLGIPLVADAASENLQFEYFGKPAALACLERGGKRYVRTADLLKLTETENAFASRAEVAAALGVTHVRSVHLIVPHDGVAFTFNGIEYSLQWIRQGQHSYVSRKSLEAFVRYRKITNNSLREYYRLSSLTADSNVPFSVEHDGLVLSRRASISLPVEEVGGTYYVAREYGPLVRFYLDLQSPFRRSRMRAIGSFKDMHRGPVDFSNPALIMLDELCEREKEEEVLAYVQREVFEPRRATDVLEKYPALSSHVRAHVDGATLPLPTPHRDIETVLVKNGIPFESLPALKDLYPFLFDYCGMELPLLEGGRLFRKYYELLEFYARLLYTTPEEGLACAKSFLHTPGFITGDPVSRAKLWLTRYYYLTHALTYEDASFFDGRLEDERIFGLFELSSGARTLLFGRSNPQASEKELKEWAASFFTPEA